MSSKPVSAAPDASPSERTPAPPAPGSGDRLGATLTLAAIVHGIALLGVGFVVEPPAPVRPTLDVILSQTRSEPPPEHADFLAPSAQAGGGEQESVERPREPQAAELPLPDPGQAEQPSTAQSPPTPPEPTPSVLTSTDSEQPTPSDDPEPPTETPLPLGREHHELAREAARLAAEIEREQALYAKRPKRKFISASTSEFEWAAYVRAWVLRVERIGNLNYPDEARRRALAGSLVLTVAVRRDGAVDSIELVRSSGQPLLDEAAIRTVRLSEPFPPLPENSERIDVLHITRTWRYLDDGRLSQEP